MKDSKTFKICLTGGPCSGKTTSLARILQTFSPEFTVYTLPEVATMTFSSGVTIIPSEFTEETHRTFTTGICQMQIDLEKYFETIAGTQKKRVIMVTDRGVCDNFAYCSPENKEKVMDERGWTSNFLNNERYDMVIHLVTAAIGAEEFYTLENNAARFESIEEAAAVDRRIQSEWMSHPNFIIVDNSKGGFQKKIERVLNAVSNLTGATSKHKIVRKFLLAKEYTPDNLPEGLHYNIFSETHNYLITNKPTLVNWIFKRRYKNHSYPLFVYVSRTLEEKHERRIETHKTISEKLYFDFLSQKDRQYAPVNKHILSFLYKNKSQFNIYQIETIVVNEKNILTLKVIRDSEHDEENIIPDFLEVKEEITENPQYFTINIARL